MSNVTDPSPQKSPWAPPDPAAQPHPSSLPLHHEVMAEGFVPGEEVSVAVVLREVSARMDGRARALIADPELSRNRLVILMGYTSGTTAVMAVPEV